MDLSHLHFQKENRFLFPTEFTFLSIFLSRNTGNIVTAQPYIAVCQFSPEHIQELSH